jgi:hypothetical protein
MRAHERSVGRPGSGGVEPGGGLWGVSPLGGVGKMILLSGIIVSFIL